MNIYFNSSSNIRNRDISLISLISLISILTSSLRLLFFLFVVNTCLFLDANTCLFNVVRCKMSSKSRISPTLAFHYSAALSAVASAALSAAFLVAKSNFVPRTCLAALRIVIILVMSSGLPKPKSLPKSDNSISLILV